MECIKIGLSTKNNTSVQVITRHFLIKVLYIFYGGFLVSNVPSVVCNSEWTNHLTFDQIYNNTDFVQIRPYNVPIFNSFIDEQPISHTHSYFQQIPENNEIDYDRFLDYREPNKNKDKLLVGFARDPYRQSIPEEEYLNGVREVSSYYKNEGRGKRGVVHLYNMIYCATGCDPLTYKGYGCYCGFLGSGRPTDGIDRCCQMHDRCYENIYCPFYTVYFQPYYWKCYHGTPLCALENYETSHSFVNGCAARLCECDRLFAMCVRRYRCPNQNHPPLCHSSPLRLLQNILRQIGK